MMNYKEKKSYESPELELVHINGTDIITASDPGFDLEYDWLKGAPKAPIQEN